MLYRCKKCGGLYRVKGWDTTKTYPSDSEPSGQTCKCPKCLSELVLEEDEDSQLSSERYQLKELLGKGGMGEVWKAWQSDLGRWVALKLLTGGTEEDIARFIREARLAAKLSHPNIVQIYEVGKIGNRYFIAMQYIKGQPLNTYPIRDQHLLLTIMKQVAQAVHYAHQQGIIHRDIKPDNIIIEEDSTHPESPQNIPRVYVTDFGLAKMLHHQDKALSVSGTLMGTPAYMSPEQACGHVNVDARADVYSLGATLYEMMTMRAPFDGATVVDIALKVVNQDPKPVRKIDPKIPSEISTIIQKAMEKEPHRRYQSALAFAQDIERFLEGRPIQAKPPSLGDRTIRRVRKNPALAIAILVAILSVVAGGIIAGIQISKRDTARLRWVEEKTELARLNLLWTDIISAKIEFYRGSGDLDRMRQRLQGTLDELTRFIKRNPNVAQGWYARARGKMYFQDYEGAEGDLTQALKIAPDFGPAWMLLAQVYLEQSAQKTVGFQKTKEQREKEIQILLEKAEAALSRVKEEDLQKLGLRKTPEDEVNEVLLRALRSYYIQKDYKQAKEILVDALKKTESEEFYNWLGFWAGHTPEAIQYQDQALKIMPNYAKAYFDRGRTKLILRDYAGAIEDYNQVVKINPDNFGAYCNRGAAKSGMQDFAGSLEDLSQAIRLNPNLPELYSLRVQCRENLKDLTGAIEDCNETIRLDPNNAQLYYQRGFIHYRLEHWSNAVADWEKAIQLSPTYKGLLEGIMRQAKEKMKPKEPR